MADRDIFEEMVRAGAVAMWGSSERDATKIARMVLSAALAGRQVVPATVPGEMPPVPCPDCHHPTEHDGDVFTCTSCRQVFAHPHGMVLSQWRDLWRAWTAGCAVVHLPPSTTPTLSEETP